MPSRHHIALDGWRGIAAIMVTLHHFITSGTLYSLILVKNAWLFVDFFFVLSGFVIAANYRDRLTTGFGVGRFLLLRLGRLYPLHFIMLMAFVISELILLLTQGSVQLSGRTYFSGQNSVEGIFSSLLLVQGLGFHTGIVWNGVAWSISTEICAYLAFALIAVRFPKRLGLAMVLVIVISTIFVLPEPYRPSERFISLARCLTGFAIGVLLNALYEHVIRKKLLNQYGFFAFTALEFLTLGIALVFVMESAHLPATLLAPYAFAPVVFIYAFDRGLVSRLLANPLFIWLGMLSYSIYMIHPFVQSRLMVVAGLAFQKFTGVTIVARDYSQNDGAYVWGGTTLEGNIATIGMIVLIIFLSYWTYRLIEVPGQNAMKRYITAKKTLISSGSVSVS